VSGADSQARIVFLGTAGGPTLAERRHGIATAFVLGEDVYLVDAGLGVANQYVDAGLRLDRLRAVLLTHMHGDHVCDLFNLFMFGSTAVHGSRPGIKDTVQVIGPGPTAGSRGSFEPYGSPPFAGIGGLLEHSYAAQAATLTAWAMGQGNLRDLVDLHEIEDRGSEPFTVLDNGEVTVRAVVVPHLPTSYAYRIDSAAGSAVFSGDTGPSDAVASLARGADVLVHEVMDIGAMIAEGLPEELSDVFKSVHTEVSDVGRIAAAAGVPVLVLNHFVPASRTADPQEWTGRIGKDYDGRVIVAEDLMSVPVGRPGPAHHLPLSGQEML
jgi:ribonuclease BN (tRNA processing enzyme)